MLKKKNNFDILYFLVKIHSSIVVFDNNLQFSGRNFYTYLNVFNINEKNCIHYVAASSLIRKFYRKFVYEIPTKFKHTRNLICLF